LTLNDINNALLIAVGVLGLATFIIFSSLRWWKWWSGRATWALWFAVIFCSASFSLQETVFTEKGAIETFTLSVLCLILLFNLCVHVYKKWFWKPEHDVKHEAKHGASEVY
jgi:hypothetical protein